VRREPVVLAVLKRKHKQLKLHLLLRQQLLEHRRQPNNNLANDCLDNKLKASFLQDAFFVDIP
jgi:hypothetical protein